MYALATTLSVTSMRSQFSQNAHIAKATSSPKKKRWENKPRKGKQPRDVSKQIVLI